jgi:DNA-binding ferritin-like protein
MTCIEQAQGLLAYLRFLSNEHQVAHWTCTGENFFSDHGLYGRLYGEVAPLVDPLAERMVGQWGSVAVDSLKTAQVVHTLTASATNLDMDSQAGKLLAFTRGAEELYDDLRAAMDSEGILTTGWEDLLDAQRHVFESHEYLLQQRVGVQVAQATLEQDWFADTPVSEYFKAASEGVADTSEHWFHDNPDKRAIRDLAESGAKSNLPESGLDKPGAPPTPMENIDETPGSAEISTLSRFLVSTDQPTEDKVPETREDLPMHPVLASWSFMEGE